ncbi:hypothetical protein B0H12DRAFT_1159304 [Mycena haematopus]|nr:hypothetical protein B0H12DRAFT_1159304 [Mycena haematopus]
MLETHPWTCPDICTNYTDDLVCMTVMGGAGMARVGDGSPGSTLPSGTCGVGSATMSISRAQGSGMADTRSHSLTPKLLSRLTNLGCEPGRSGSCMRRRGKERASPPCISLLVVSILRSSMAPAPDAPPTVWP